MLRAYMGSHASTAQVVPYVTSKSTILSGVPYAEQTLRLSKNRQVFPGEDKRPDGLTLVPWQGGRCLAWDATVVDTLAPSYVAVSAQVTGSAAQAAGERKVSKYAGLSASHLFVPIAIETFGPINDWTLFLVRTGKASLDNLRRSQRVFLSLPAPLHSHTKV